MKFMIALFLLASIVYSQGEADSVIFDSVSLDSASVKTTIKVEQTKTENKTDSSGGNELIQTGFFGIEYLPNILGTPWGIRTVFVYPEQKWGFSCTISFNNSTDAGTVYDDLGPNAFGDNVTGTVYNLLSISFGYIYPFNSHDWSYVSLGYTSKSAYTQLNDQSQILDPNGTYFVPDHSKDVSSISIGVGYIHRFSWLTLGIGVEYPSAIYLGIGWNISTSSYWSNTRSKGN